MKMQKLYVVLILSVCVSSAFARNEPRRVKLYPPHDKATGKYDERRACFNFKSGTRKKRVKDWDLGYGFLAIRDEDWFIVSPFDESRSVMKDLGELQWTDSFKLPILEPLPKLVKGESRLFTVDSSGDTGKTWANTTTTMAKVVIGHMYLMRIKNEKSDFYAMFRVEDLKQRKFCIISWKRIPAPKR